MPNTIQPGDSESFDGWWQRRLFAHSRSTATRTSSTPIAMTMAVGSTRIGLTLTTTGMTMVRLLGLSRESLYFSPDFSGEFCFTICPYQPPSIFPATAKGSDRAIYFLSSIVFISHAIKRKNLRESNEMIAFFTNGCFSCICKKLAMSMFSIVRKKYLSIVSPRVYRDVLEKVTIYSCQSL